YGLRLGALLGLPRGAGRDRRGVRFGDLLEDRRFVRRVSLHRLDEVRDQVVTPLELNFYVRPGLFHALTQRVEAVVRRDEEERDRPDDDKDDYDLHEPLP